MGFVLQLVCSLCFFFRPSAFAFCGICERYQCPRVNVNRVSVCLELWGLHPHPWCSQSTWSSGGTRKPHTCLALDPPPIQEVVSDFVSADTEGTFLQGIIALQIPETSGDKTASSAHPRACRFCRFHCSHSTLSSASFSPSKEL